MQSRARIYLSPIAALVTLAIGVGFVRAAETVVSLFEPAAFTGRESPMEENIGVTSTENFKSFLPERTTRGRVLACYDPAVLQIWQELKTDIGFRERLQLSTGLFNCSEMVQVNRLDLNRDGNQEFLVRGKGTVQCAGIGNCGYWIFEIKDGVVRRLMSSVHEADAHEFGVDEVQASGTRGYSDILLASRDGQNVKHFQTYVFDGTAYVKARCMSEVPRPLRDGSGSWELITCEEFYRRRDEMRETVARMLD